MMDPFQNNMATQFGRFRILFRKSFIENVYINILKNIFFCNSFYLIIFLKHLRCFFTYLFGMWRKQPKTLRKDNVFTYSRHLDRRLAGRSCLRQLVSLEKNRGGGWGRNISKLPILVVRRHEQRQRLHQA